MERAEGTRPGVDEGILPREESRTLSTHATYLSKIYYLSLYLLAPSPRPPSPHPPPWPPPPSTRPSSPIQTFLPAIPSPARRNASAAPPASRAPNVAGSSRSRRSHPDRTGLIHAPGALPPSPARLKLRCDRAIPCGSCVKRGCAAICPDGASPTSTSLYPAFHPTYPPPSGSLTTGKGNR